MITLTHFQRQIGRGAGTTLVLEARPKRRMKGSAGTGTIPPLSYVECGGE